MTDKLLTPAHQLSSITSSLSIISLDDWALVTVTGPDRLRYLQGQITADINALKPDRHMLCAHCDAKGKMWSSLIVFHQREHIAFIERKSLLNTQLTELRKYAVFSRVSINQDEQTLLSGICGQQARELLASIFGTLPDAEHSVVQHQQSTLLHFSLPEERFLLISSHEQVEILKDEARKAGYNVQLNGSQQWLSLDIAAGYPIIDAVNSGVFLPQAVNLQALDGISFTKGCYTGQETVARAKYRGTNKRALYWLAGQSARVPAAGEDLEFQLMDGNWRRTGTVLVASQLPDGILWVQAVLNNDTTIDTKLRIPGDDSSELCIQALPYSLSEQLTTTNG